MEIIKLYRGGVTDAELNGEPFDIGLVISGKWWTPSLCYALSIQNRRLWHDEDENSPMTRHVIMTNAKIDDCFADLDTDKCAVFLDKAENIEILTSRDKPFFYFDYNSNMLQTVNLGARFFDAVLQNKLYLFGRIKEHYGGNIRMANKDWKMYLSLNEGKYRDIKLYEPILREIHKRTHESKSDFQAKLEKYKEKTQEIRDFVGKYQIDINEMVASENNS